MKKACVFVDGENLRYSLVGCLCDTTDFLQADYLPKNANWSQFFDHIVNEASNNTSERLRTYWYVIESVDFIPYRFEKLIGQDLQNTLKKNKECKQKIISASDKDAEATTIKDGLIRKKKHFSSRFNGWQSIQNGIATKHKAIQFKRSGAIKYNLFTEELGEEKTVDVSLAVDALIMEKNYDIAIIVSGDQDYVPIAQALRDRGKTVVNVSFKKKNGQLLPGGAARLNMNVDWSYELNFADLAHLMNVSIK